MRNRLKTKRHYPAGMAGKMEQVYVIVLTALEWLPEVVMRGKLLEPQQQM